MDRPKVYNNFTSMMKLSWNTLMAFVLSIGLSSGTIICNYQGLTNISYTQLNDAGCEYVINYNAYISKNGSLEFKMKEQKEVTEIFRDLNRLNSSVKFYLGLNMCSGDNSYIPGVSETKYAGSVNKFIDFSKVSGYDGIYLKFCLPSTNTDSISDHVMVSVRDTLVSSPMEVGVYGFSFPGFDTYANTISWIVTNYDVYTLDLAYGECFVVSNKAYVPSFAGSYKKIFVVTINFLEKESPSFVEMCSLPEPFLYTIMLNYADTFTESLNKIRQEIDGLMINILDKNFVGGNCTRGGLTLTVDTIEMFKDVWSSFEAYYFISE